MLEATDSATAARAGRLFTDRGEVETPVFMPVGTQAAVRAMTPQQVRATGVRIVLANSYHLTLRPGERLVRKAGGEMSIPLLRKALEDDVAAVREKAARELATFDD